MVDAPASGAGDRKVVGVRVPSWAPNTLAMTYMGMNISISSKLPRTLITRILQRQHKTLSRYVMNLL